MKILLVEDNLENASLIIRILQTGGYEVTHKLLGLEGMAAARTNAFDAILLDFNLPDIDGSQIGLALRKRLPKTRIIALTAHADKITREKAKMFGFDAFIPKPFTDDDLLNVMQILVKPKPVETQPKPVETQPKPVEAELKAVENKPKPIEDKPKSVETEPKPVETKT